MSVLSSDLKFYLTVSGSAIEDGSAQPDPNDSLGGFRSNVEISSGDLNNLFDDITSGQAAAGHSDWRCIAVKNTSAETLFNARMYILSEFDPSNDQTIEIAVERPATAGLVDGDSQVIADEDTAPTLNATEHNGAGSGVSALASPEDSAAAIGVDQGAAGSGLATGEVVFLWIKRTIEVGAQAQSNMSFTTRIVGDTN